MIEIKDGIYYSRMYYAELLIGGVAGNMMGIVYKAPDKDCWSMRLRTRRYMDDKAHDSADISEWLSFSSEPGEDIEALLGRTIAKMRRLIPNVQEVILDSDNAEYVLNVIAAQPWANMRVERADGRPIAEA